MALKRELPRMPFPATSNVVIKKKTVKFVFANDQQKFGRIVVGNAYVRDFKAEEQPFEEEIAKFNQFLAKKTMFRRV